MLGLPGARSSPKMSRRGPWQGFLRGRRRRKAGFTTMESATTELARLPGLEAVGGRMDPKPKPGHWIERGPQKRLMVFSGRSHPDLAQRIAEKLGVELGEVALE